MKLCRFQIKNGPVRAGAVTADDRVLDLSAAGIESLAPLLEHDDPAAELRRITATVLPSLPVSAVRFCAPVDQQEVWAAGVTYLRSKRARMEESDFSASAYDRVYEAPRPEIFFKSMPHKVAGPGDAVGIRSDGKWNVPEPELALVLNSRGRLVGYTIGNDMSSRDIEGENLLYLPQGKIYTGSCALGPVITLGASEAEARGWSIHLDIERAGASVFSGDTQVSQIKRSFEELIGYLFRSQTFPAGAILLTGTGVVPPDAFTLEAGDVVRIRISGVGTLENPVQRV